MIFILYTLYLKLSTYRIIFRGADNWIHRFHTFIFDLRVYHAGTFQIPDYLSL